MENHKPDEIIEIPEVCTACVKGDTIDLNDETPEVDERRSSHPYLQITTIPVFDHLTGTER